MANSEEIKSAEISDSSVIERQSIIILEGILDTSKVITHIAKNDTIPNYDGYLEIRGEDRLSIGKIEIQIKTHRENYTTPSYSVELKLLAYARDTVQLPFILIAVDQKNKKVFWKEITPESARQYINEALSRNEEQKSLSIPFDMDKEITNNPPYSIWKEIVESHKKVIRDSSDLNNKLILTQEELKKLKTQLDFGERDENPSYVQMHIFLDTLNNLFSREFQIIRKLFVSDFWKFGIVTFGQVEDSRLAYSLFSIGWNENYRQINSYKESSDFSKFISDYPSVRAYSGKNPILSTPVKYAYTKLWEYLKLMLERKLIWANDEYLQQEFLFYLRDTKFKSHKIEETEVIDLFSFKEQIEKRLESISESEKQLMTEFPEVINADLLRALDYIQNFRMQGEKIMIQQSPSKASIQNISTSVGEKGKLPENVEDTLFNYWNALLNSYENVLNEFFPLVKEELNDINYTYIIIPFIDSSSFNNTIFNVAYLRILKFIDKNNSIVGKKIIVEMNEANVRFDYLTRTVHHNGQKYDVSSYENEKISISSLIDEMPIRKGVYNLLNRNFKNYFEEIKEGEM